MRALYLALLWLGGVVLFAACGDFYAEWTEFVLFASIGIVPVSYVVLGLILVGLVYSQRVTKGKALILLFLSSIFGLVLTCFTIFLGVPIAARLAGIHSFEGESGMILLFSGYLAFWIIFVGFLILAASVLVSKKRAPTIASP